MTIKSQKWLQSIKYMGCIVCSHCMGIEDTPSDIHHLTEGGNRIGQTEEENDLHSIPVCPAHHRYSQNKTCVSIADGRKKFFEAYKVTEMDLLKITQRRLGYDSK